MRAFKHNNERRAPFFIIAPLLPQAMYDGQDSLLQSAIHTACKRSSTTMSDVHFFFYCSTIAAGGV
jgi:hypothetical protein